ncbi:hypothetical protein [Chryseobacterium foetidum]|uniref:hypothetical protein n=1 Tax=Chryseobacterium foetidum TaxID=2951057 RepID=UPI0021C896EF|nr:hypothetical protein [Chryseobacterium foetidum]
MKHTTIIFVFLLLLSSITFGQTKKDLVIDFMLRGNIYAQSSIEDSTALGGFGGSENLPKIINAKNDFSENGLFLKIDTTNLVTINDKFNGYRFYIVNKSDTITKLDASDSRLYVIAEVLYKNEWKPIEYLPSSSCGNSYHQVYLKQNEYWEFTVPKFSGKINTKLRYKLMIGEQKYIYSNEILTSINKNQLKQKQGHKPNGIMDPYND